MAAMATSVTIPAGDTEATAAIDVTSDAIAEGTETVILTLGSNSGAPSGVTVNNHAINFASANIIDNDLTVVVSIAATSNAEEDATDGLFTISIDKELSTALNINLATTGTATNGTDMAAMATSVTIPAGDTEATAAIYVTSDVIAEGTETVTLTLGSNSGAPSGVTVNNHAPNFATANIIDNDLANISIANVSTDEDIIGGQATFVVTLNGNVENSFSVNYSTSNISASAGSDYQAASGFITFPDNSDDGATETFTVNIINDNVVEDSETYLVTLSDITGGIVTIGNTTATSTITDDDEATVSINSPGNVSEGNNIIFTVSVNKAVQGGFTIAYATVDGTATIVGFDYTTNSGTINFTGNQNESHTITVATNNDNIVEATETLTLVLGSVTNNDGTVTISGVNGIGTGTLLDNDYAAITIANVSGAENGGDITVSLVLDVDVDEAFTLNVNTSDGTATTGDYINVVNQTISFAGFAGEIKTFTFTPVDDDILEDNETVLVAMSALSTSRSVNITDEAIITITNDDAATLTIDNQSATEGNNILFTLELSDDVQGDVVVNVSFIHMTTEPGDFTSTSQYITFANGSKGTKTITVPTNNDTRLEEEESFTAVLSVTSGNTAIDGSDTGSGTITDNDAASVTISDASVDEGGNVMFSLELTNDVEGNVEVQVNFENTTASDDDYSGTSQNFTFTGGLKGTKTVTVPTTGDTKLEGNETFVARITLISGNSEVVVLDTGIGTINNDDVASVTIADVSADEDGGAITVTATLDFAVQGGFTVEVNTADGSAATADSDYAAVTNYTLTFAGNAGETQTFSVTPSADTKLESDETLTVSLGNLDNTTLAVDITGGATVTIENDDVASVTIADVSADEDGGAITVTATLDFAVQGGFTVEVNTADGSAATADSDYAAVTNHTRSLLPVMQAKLRLSLLLRLLIQNLKVMKR